MKGVFSARGLQTGGLVSTPLSHKRRICPSVNEGRSGVDAQVLKAICSSFKIPEIEGRYDRSGAMMEGTKRKRQQKGTERREQTDGWMENREEHLGKAFRLM